MNAGRFGSSALAWALLLAYASLYPFAPLRAPSPEAVQAVFRFAGRVIASDVAFNVAAYVPFGLLLTLAFRSRGDRGRAMAKAVAIAAGFSLSMEVAQLFVAGRVSSMVDFITNTAGAAIGSAAFIDPFYSLVTRPLGALRERQLIPGAWGDAGLVLLVLWLFAQMNPALPFFGAGDVARGIEADYGALQWAAVAMGICGFSLFLSVLGQGEQGSLRAALVLLSIALWLKFAMASVMLQPYASAEWARGGRVEGIALGLLAFIPLRRMPRVGRAYLAFVLILAGALFAKIFGVFSAMEEFLRIFRWPHGQLASFASLTRFLHELWPFAAVAYLVGLFLRDRLGARAARMPP